LSEIWSLLGYFYLPDLAVSTFGKMAPPAPSNRPAYEKNEKVLCFHHELLYEAKVMDDPQREDEKDPMSAWRFLIHYKGWKNT
jgi:hypothetical protein